MRQSQLFTKTRREAPKDEVAKNAQLLIRGGFIHKEMAGVYSFLPLGLRVFRKIEQVIREEMNAIGGQEIVLSALQRPALWKKSGRRSDAGIDVWFRTELKGGGELGLATTHEEPLTAPHERIRFFVQGPSVLRLPIPDEIQERTACQERDYPHAGIRDEGYVFLQPKRNGVP